MATPVLLPDNLFSGLLAELSRDFFAKARILKLTGASPARRQWGVGGNKLPLSLKGRVARALLILAAAFGQDVGGGRILAR